MHEIGRRYGPSSGRAAPSLREGPYRQFKKATGRRSTYPLPIPVQTNRARSHPCLHESPIDAHKSQLACRRQGCQWQQPDDNLPDDFVEEINNAAQRSEELAHRRKQVHAALEKAPTS